MWISKLTIASNLGKFQPNRSKEVAKDSNVKVSALKKYVSSLKVKQAC